MKKDFYYELIFLRNLVFIYMIIAGLSGGISMLFVILGDLELIWGFLICFITTPLCIILAYVNTKLKQL